ncbi:MAG: biopolymer transporter ExbD [Planctomycetes bacterium]|nr:biopolymer transporter ExbD [Planctomycetota bacterium]
MKFSRRGLAREAPRSAAFLDVLFILLITFFLVTSLAEEESTSDEPRVEVRLPKLERGEKSGGDEGAQPLRLVLFADGRLAADDRALGVGALALRDLEEILAKRAAAEAPAIARIYTDEASRAEHLLPLLALLREQSFERIDLLGREASASEVAR